MCGLTELSRITLSNGDGVLDVGHLRGAVENAGVGATVMGNAKKAIDLASCDLSFNELNEEEAEEAECSMWTVSDELVSVLQAVVLGGRRPPVLPARIRYRHCHPPGLAPQWVRQPARPLEPLTESQVACPARRARQPPRRQ